jgi:hypothetical protein
MQSFKTCGPESEIRIPNERADAHGSAQVLPQVAGLAVSGSEMNLLGLWAD